MLEFSDPLPLPPVPKRATQKDCFRLNCSVNYQLRLWLQNPARSLGEMSRTSESWEIPSALALGSLQVYTKIKRSSLVRFFLLTHFWILTLLVLNFRWQIKLIPSETNIQHTTPSKRKKRKSGYPIFPPRMVTTSTHMLWSYYIHCLGPFLVGEWRKGRKLEILLERWAFHWWQDKISISLRRLIVTLRWIEVVSSGGRETIWELLQWLRYGVYQGSGTELGKKSRRNGPSWYSQALRSIRITYRAC